MTGSARHIARELIDASLYMVLATADASGRPWSSPVYFAHTAYREFLWVSSPEVAHSRNIAERAQVGIAIFDSRAPIGTGQGVYVSALAEQLNGAEAAAAIEVFSARARSTAAPPGGPGDLGPGTGMCLYRAVADGHWILAKDGRPDHRIPVEPGEPG